MDSGQNQQQVRVGQLGRLTNVFFLILKTKSTGYDYENRIIKEILGCHNS